MVRGPIVRLRIGHRQDQHPARFAFLEKFEIPHMDRPDVNYLERLRIVQTPWFSLYLHRIGTPDSRPTLHDHPWCFVSLILRGGYIERRLNLHTREVSLKHRRRLNIMRRDDAHAILELDRTPTWSLLLVGRRRRTWGYWRPLNEATGSWYWCPFDRDVHSAEFDEAMARRRQ
jgi:hypothetical protein